MSCPSLSFLVFVSFYLYLRPRAGNTTTKRIGGGTAARSFFRADPFGPAWSCSIRFYIFALIGLGLMRCVSRCGGGGSAYLPIPFAAATLPSSQPCRVVVHLLLVDAIPRHALDPNRCRARCPTAVQGLDSALLPTRGESIHARSAGTVHQLWGWVFWHGALKFRRWVEPTMHACEESVACFFVFLLPWRALRFCRILYPGGRYMCRRVVVSTALVLLFSRCCPSKLPRKRGRESYREVHCSTSHLLCSLVVLVSSCRHAACQHRFEL